MAANWLWSQGYEVFENISHIGPIDLIALKDGTIIKIDVKVINSKYKDDLRSDVQKELDVKYLFVDIEGNAFSWSMEEYYARPL